MPQKIKSVLFISILHASKTMVVPTITKGQQHYRQILADFLIHLCNSKTPYVYLIHGPVHTICHLCHQLGLSGEEYTNLLVNSKLATKYKSSDRIQIRPSYWTSFLRDHPTRSPGDPYHRSNTNSACKDGLSCCIEKKVGVLCFN